MLNSTDAEESVPISSYVGTAPTPFKLQFSKNSDEELIIVISFLNQKDNSFISQNIIDIKPD